MKFKLLLIAALTSVSLTAFGQAYPNKPIKAIVPFAAGSATDQIGRAFAAKMSETLGQTIVVDNRPGVNGMLGADAVAKSPADGYTLTVSPASFLTTNKSVFKSLPYDPETDFSPVSLLVNQPTGSPASPRYKTIEPTAPPETVTTH